MAPDTDVTVVVATRNRRDELLETLGRLAALGPAPAVVVVDNGSSDGTPAAVRSARPAVDLVALPANRGAAARTLGAARAATPLVAFADDDSWWGAGALERAARLFARGPSVGLVAARVVVEPDGSTDPTCAAMAASPAQLELDRPAGGPPTRHPLVWGFLACGAVVRRRAFLSVGGFAAGLGTGGEEERLALDLAAAGWRSVYAADVVAHHRPSAARDPAERRRVVTRNALWTAWTRRPAASAVLRTATVLAGARHRPELTGICLAVAGAGRVLADRRPVPPEVEADLRALARAGRTPGSGPPKVVRDRCAAAGSGSAPPLPRCPGPPATR